MRVRPLRPDDGPALERLARACDPEDLRLRFFQAIGEGQRSLLDKLTRLDPARDAAFIGFEPVGRTPLGVVRLHGDPDGARRSSRSSCAATPTITGSGMR